MTFSVRSSGNTGFLPTKFREEREAKSNPLRELGKVEMVAVASISSSISWGI